MEQERKLQMAEAENKKSTKPVAVSICFSVSCVSLHSSLEPTYQITANTGGHEALNLPLKIPLRFTPGSTCLCY